MSKKGKAPADQFYWSDWLNDTALQSASTVSRGVWINALCRMWAAPIRGELTGTIETLAKLCICDVTDFVTLKNDILTHKFADMSQDPVTGIVTIRNRRMYRKGKEQEYNRLRKIKQRQSRKCHGDVTDPCHGGVTAPSSSSFKEEKEKKDVTVGNQDENHRVPYAEIRKSWIEILPELPRPREENSTWHKDCRARWIQYEKAQDITWWPKFFGKIRDNPHWMGENDRGWKPSISWFMQQKNFFKVLER